MGDVAPVLFSAFKSVLLVYCSCAALLVEVNYTTILPVFTIYWKLVGIDYVYAKTWRAIFLVVEKTSAEIV